MNTDFLCISLGFSAGVMVYVSFMEILPEGIAALSAVYSHDKAQIVSFIAFFVGILIFALIDWLIPENNNPHEIKNTSDELIHKNSLLRTGIFSALAVAIHNFPEGLATFMSSLVNPELGVSIAIAIAIHNIPEGIAIAAPIYYATKKRGKAFLYSFFSGLAEPIGAIVGFLLLRQIFSDQLMGIIFSIVAGIMVYLSFDELLPTAEEYGKHHLVIGGVVAGMAVMGISLILF